MGIHWLAASSSARAGSGAVGIKEATIHTAAIHTHVLGKCRTKTLDRGGIGNRFGEFPGSL
jgi:hypothetical protein